MKKMAIATMFSAALALGMPAASTYAQQPATTGTAATTTAGDHDGAKAKDEAKKAGDDAKDAAKKSGKAAKHAAKATAHATKSTGKTVAKDSKHVSKTLEQDTTGAVKTSGSEAKAATDAAKDEMKGEHGSATAKCADGTFWYAASHSGACADHGGVSNWIK